MGMASDYGPHADEVGSPDDGKGQAPPVTFREPNVYALTREPAYMQQFGQASPLITHMPEEDQ